MYSLRSQRKKFDPRSDHKSRKSKDERALVEKNAISSSENLSQRTVDFPVRKKRQTAAKTSSPIIDSPSVKKDESNAIIEKAKSAFHSGSTPHLMCRETEIGYLESFLSTHVESHIPGSLYISGPPGTGKTATLMYLLDQMEDHLNEVDVVILNCMTLSTPQSIFNKISSQLGLKGRTYTEKIVADHITLSQSMILLVLDEIDQLDSHGQQVLYKLFEWPSLPDSHVILIGIANSLDLTDRLLPRLKAHPHTTPDLLIFPPYTKDQILQILESRLSSETAAVIDTLALQFCARKVAAAHGDARKALDICRRAVELFDTQIKYQEISDKNSRKVSISHVSSIIEEVYGGSVKRTDVAEGVPLQQKLVACSILLATKEKANKEVPLGKLYSIYTNVCKKQDLRYEGQSEFVSLANMLEAQSIVTITRKGKEVLLHKVSLRYQESELAHLLKDQTLLSTVLEKGL